MVVISFRGKSLIAMLGLLVLLLVVSVRGQQKERQESGRSGDEPIKLGTTLVQVPVVVSDRGGRYITDLKEQDFVLFEDGVRQSIEFFGSVDEPFSVALLLDCSGSTSAQLDLIKYAAEAFIDSLRPQDRVMVLSFDDSVKIQCELTGNRDELRRAVRRIEVGEYTQVYEAVYTAVWERLHEINGRKAVILFTDGIDTASSEITEEDTLDAVVESEDIIIYPIRYSTRSDVERKLERGRGLRVSNRESNANVYRELDHTYRKADEYLQELADLSGGIVERADQLADLKGAFQRIAEELRHQYLLGYYPTNKEKREVDRKIKVQVSRPNVKVRARPGYRIAEDSSSNK